MEVSKRLASAAIVLRVLSSVHETSKIQPKSQLRVKIVVSGIEIRSTIFQKFLKYLDLCFSAKNYRTSVLTIYGIKRSVMSPKIFALTSSVPSESVSR